MAALPGFVGDDEFFTAVLIGQAQHGGEAGLAHEFGYVALVILQQPVHAGVIPPAGGHDGGQAMAAGLQHVGQVRIHDVLALTNVIGEGGIQLFQIQQIIFSVQIHALITHAADVQAGVLQALRHREIPVEQGSLLHRTGIADPGAFQSTVLQSFCKRFLRRLRPEFPAQCPAPRLQAGRDRGVGDGLFVVFTQPLSQRMSFSRYTTA